MRNLASNTAPFSYNLNILVKHFRDLHKMELRMEKEFILCSQADIDDFDFKMNINILTVA